ncbi:MAG TPA: glycosyltransferase N-terminal domain-containing protein [Caulobacteraceae bacterium]|jgi:3-deoxy-D-manno-octulosonic-acid transferase
MSLGLAAYRCLTGLLEPLAPRILEGRARRGKEDPARTGERLGRPSLSRPQGELVWLHGASVGETLSLLPLVEALADARPDLTLLVTSGTVAAAEVMKQRLPAAVLHQYAPVDAPGPVTRFLTHWRPCVAVFVESELWPNLLHHARKAGCRLALLGARISDDSAKGWARAPRSARALLSAFDLILAQDARSVAKLEGLGGKVAGELDLKQAAAPLPHDEVELQVLKNELCGRPVVVAASTHPGEEEQVVAALRALPEPRPLLVLAPRHPARGQDLADRLRAQGLKLSRRGVGERIAGDTEIYLADTLGELGLLFRLAQVVVMGGGFGEGVGGHNPLEPARLGLPVLTGPDIANFNETYAGLLQAHAALVTPHQAALNAALADLLANPQRAAEMGERARAHARSRHDAAKIALDALEPLLPKAPLK